MEKIVNITAFAALIIAGMIVVAPCLLMFTEGEDGGMTIWNVVGLAYMVGLIMLVKHSNIFSNG